MPEGRGSTVRHGRTLPAQEEFNPGDAESFKPWKQVLPFPPVPA